MLNSKEIEKAVISLDTPPDTFTNTEFHLFFVLQNILIRYKSGGLSKDQASRLKAKAINNYNHDVFIRETYMRHISNRSKASPLIIEMRKNPSIETALKIIELSLGEVGMWNINTEQS